MLHLAPFESSSEPRTMRHVSFYTQRWIVVRTTTAHVISTDIIRQMIFSNAAPRTWNSAPLQLPNGITALYNLIILYHYI